MTHRQNNQYKNVAAYTAHKATRRRRSAREFQRQHIALGGENDGGADLIQAGIDGAVRAGTRIRSDLVATYEAQGYYVPPEVGGTSQEDGCNKCGGV